MSASNIRSTATTTQSFSKSTRCLFPIRPALRAGGLE